MPSVDIWYTPVIDKIVCMKNGFDIKMTVKSNDIGIVFKSEGVV